MNAYEALIQKHGELTGIIAKIAEEGRVATEQETAQIKALKADVEKINADFASTGRKAFLGGLSRTEPKTGAILTKSDSFADVFKGEADPELEKASLGRMVRGAITGDWRNADLEKKTMLSSSATAGGYLIPEPLSARVLDLARNRALTVQAGVGTIPMTSQTLALAAITGNPTVEWTAENATISETDMTFGRREFVAKKMAAICRVSNELLEDAQNIDTIIETALADAIALELDRTVLFGTGVGQPLGIFETSGVTESTSVGTPTSYDKFLDAIYSVRGYNYEPNAVMYSSRTAQTLAKLKTGLTSDKTPLVQPADFAALSKYVTNQVSNTLGGGAESAAFVGQWNQYAIALRSQIRLEVSREADTAFTKDQTLIRVVWRGDGMLLQPTAFTVMSGITA